MVIAAKDGRVWKEDLKGVYDGTLFWTLKEENEKHGGSGRGLGVVEGWMFVKKGWSDYLRGDTTCKL
jgi:hypothetical protein